MEIDFDVPLVVLNSSLEVAEPKSDLIALVDADTIVFAACLGAETEKALLPREFYTDSEYEELLANPTYNKFKNCIYDFDLENAKQLVYNKLNQILEKTGCLDWELHFTVGRKSFRYTRVFDQYKANRLEDNEGNRIPIGLYQTKLALKEEYPDKVFINTEWEADDIVVALKYYYPDKYLLCALDKDVLYSLPGKHFNYYENPRFDISMKFYEVDELTAMKHHYRQALTGDSGDNVIGLSGVGPKTSDKILKNCNTKEECWNAVKDAYEARGREHLDAIINMRLVSMNQLELDSETNEFKVKLWKPE